MGNEQREEDGELIERLSVRLRKYRRRRNLTQEELAGKAGVSVATISKAERAHTLPHPSTVRKLANTLDCKEADLTE